MKNIYVHFLHTSCFEIFNNSLVIDTYNRLVRFLLSPMKQTLTSQRTPSDR